MIVRVARAGFIEKQREVMVDFMEDYVHALRCFLDPAHHDEAVALIPRRRSKARRFTRAGSIPRTTIIATPTRSRTSTRCRTTSICSTSSAFCANRSDV